MTFVRETDFSLQTSVWQIATEWGRRCTLISRIIFRIITPRSLWPLCLCERFFRRCNNVIHFRDTLFLFFLCYISIMYNETLDRITWNPAVMGGKPYSRYEGYCGHDCRANRSRYKHWRTSLWLSQSWKRLYYARYSVRCSRYRVIFL